MKKILSIIIVMLMLILPGNLVFAVNPTGNVYTVDVAKKAKQPKKIKKPKQTKPAKPIIIQKGNIKGAITWQYNDFIGTKPDVGAKIFLIPRSFDKNKISDLDANLYAMVGIVPQNSGLFFTKANGYGNYEINGMPIGKYVVVIVSDKTKRNPEEPIDDYTTFVLKPLIKNWDVFVQFNLDLKKFEVKEIEIKTNETTEYSYDFGNTYY